MKSNHIAYDYEKSRGRIDDILNSSDNWYEELWNDIPSRDKLTYSNWYYVNCTAVFVDIRWSSKLPDTHTRPVLAKLYRAYISEMVALMNWESKCREINIHWDSVWGIFETPLKKDVDSVFSMAAKISSLADTLNIKLEKKGYSGITIGIGIDDWRTLMIKAGYSGSGINDVVWMGETVNKASRLCGYWKQEIRG